MNSSFFIARRLSFGKDSKTLVSKPILKISVAGIALSVTLMIISVAVVTGFRNEIQKKISGFGAHIQILNYDSNYSFETTPVSKNLPFYPSLAEMKGIRHIQVFATKPGIIKADNEIEGAIVKGAGSDFDWSFFAENLVEGGIPVITDTAVTNDVLISKKLSSLLRLNLNDRFAMYFIDEVPRSRAFRVAGIYETSLDEFDRQFILADIAHIRRLNNWEDDMVSGFEVAIDNFRDLSYMTYLVNGIAGSGFLDDGAKLRVMNIKMKYPQIFDWLGLIDYNVYIILGLMLMVAFFNMSSGLLILILDRTYMIGILKALGSANKSIRGIFLYQTAYLMIKGLFWGNLVGISLCMLQHYFRFITLDQASYFIGYVPINLNFLHVLLLNLSTLSLTLFILLLPSMVIARISPVKTIRFN